MKDLRWSEKFAWYHFNYDEIYNYTDEDFERVAREHAERGVTTMVTFGCTHFMLSFYPYWEDIFSCIARIVRAFHKYGIKVVEHRSYSLTNRFFEEHEWNEGRALHYHPWTELKERLYSDYEIMGVKASEMAAVDGRTGKPQINNYKAYCLCPNNPDYQRISKYLANRIFDLGVDGMMNDDIQYHKNACACEHCRKKFREETGYELPYPDGWADFYENYNNPAYVAWKQFKVRSTTRYLDMIVEEEKKRGLKMLRPCYVSDILNSNWSCGSFETGVKYYMNYFQENFRPTVVRYGYSNFMAEAVDRYARTKRVNIPSMSLFYPYTPPLTYFSWALAHTWGQMYSGTVHDEDITEVERPYREFETAHCAFLGESTKNADIAIYQSVLTRDCRPAGSSFPMKSILTASNFSGLLTDMVFEEDTVEILSEYPVIVLNCASMLSGENISRLRKYAEGGGRLIIIGNSGEYDENAAKRDVNEIREMFGMKTPVVPCEDVKEGVFTYGGSSVRFDDMTCNYSFDAKNGVLEGGGKVLGVSEAVGKGEVIWLLPRLDNAPIDRACVIEYKDIEKPHPIAQPSVIPTLRKTTGALLCAIVGTPKLLCKCESDDILCSSFKTPSGYAVHLANISETFAKEEKEAWHDDPLLGFDGGYTIPKKISLSLAYSGENLPRVALYTPEKEGGLELSATIDGGRLTFDVPENTFGGYALIEITE